MSNLGFATSHETRRSLPSAVLLLVPLLLWSTVFPLSKLILEVVPSATMAAIRFSIGGLCLLAYTVWRLTWPRAIASLAEHWQTYLVLGFTGIFLNNLLQNLGLHLTAATSTSLLGASGPIFSVLLSAVFLGEPLSRRKLVGLGLAMAGVYLVTTNGKLVIDWQSTGNMLAVGSALSYSVYTVWSKKALDHEEPLLVVTWSTLLGAAMLAVSAVWMDSSQTWGSIPFAMVMNLLYLSTIPTSVAVVAYFYYLQRTQASQAAVTFFLVPVFAGCWSILLLGEHITLPMVMGGTLIVAGVWLTATLSRRSERNLP